VKFDLKAGVNGFMLSLIQLKIFYNVQFTMPWCTEFCTRSNDSIGSIEESKNLIIKQIARYDSIEYRNNSNIQALIKLTCILVEFL
jgi:hypothetical protein